MGRFPRLKIVVSPVRVRVSPVGSEHVLRGHVEGVGGRGEPEQGPERPPAQRQNAGCARERRDDGERDRVEAVQAG